jgi:thiol-disulfide isomerase/thioredoxin
MKYLKKYMIFVILLVAFLPFNVNARDNINVHFFWGVGCPHCESQKPVLEELKNKYPITIYDYEVYYNKENQKIFNDVGKLLNENIRGVPFTVIGDKTFPGFSSSITPYQLENAIKYYLDNSYRDFVGEMLGLVEKGYDGIDRTDREKPILDKINLPFIGEVDPSFYSLPIITIIFGLVDGFNPCALWILLLLIGFLIGMNDRKRMFVLGMTFILTSALIYYIFMLVWVQVVLLIGALIWIRRLIALIALIGGVYSLKSYFMNKEAGCKISESPKRNQIIEKLKIFTKENNLLLAIIGITVLAISVNFIELLCSAALPLTYTQILHLNDVSTIGYYWYLLLYVFFFMLDHIIIFTIAMVTFRLKAISTKYTKYINLIGGLLMLLIGLLMLLKPEWLMFG